MGKFRRAARSSYVTSLGRTHKAADTPRALDQVADDRGGAGGSANWRPWLDLPSPARGRRFPRTQPMKGRGTASCARRPIAKLQYPV
jgi:hypothetical protein